jgi:hypothetical protein
MELWMSGLRTSNHPPFACVLAGRPTDEFGIFSNAFIKRSKEKNRGNREKKGERDGKEMEWKIGGRFQKSGFWRKEKRDEEGMDCENVGLCGDYDFKCEPGQGYKLLMVRGCLSPG